RADAFALLFTMVFPSFMSWIEFWVLPAETADYGPELRHVFALGKIIQFAFPFIYILLTARGELRPARPHVRGMALGIAFGLAIMGGTLALYFPLLKHTDMFGDTPE